MNTLKKAINKLINCPCLYRRGSEYSGGGWEHWRPLLWGPLASVGSVPASTSASGLHCPFSGPRCPLSARHGMGGVWCRTLYSEAVH